MFESRVIQKTSRLREARRGGDPDPEAVEYLLDTIPFIREYDEAQPVMAASPTSNATVDSFLTVTDTNTGHVYDQYLATVEGDSDAMGRMAALKEDASEHVCTTCGTALAYSPVDATMVCTQCGATQVYFEGGTRGLNYQEQVDYASKRAFTYKRISHFVECLNASQAKQNTSIPDEVVAAITAEMKKYRIQPEDLSSDHVRSFLKRRGFAKYYEHVNYILSLINPTKQTSLPQHVEETLIKMFIATQQPFESVTESDRVNFLRYNYIIYKMLEIIGETDYLHLFPLLKSRHKLIQHDQVWKRICEHPTLQWPFIPTI
jgi:predicted RNA-binding Zn-ribbon protein involved in translation (DUF1610 family)